MRQIFLKLFLLAFLSGCASMGCFTQACFQEYYDSHPEELQALKDEAAADPESFFDELIYDIEDAAHTNSRLVCIDGDCVVVWIY